MLYLLKKSIMAKRDFFLRYLLIIKKLRSSQRANFKEISDYIFQQSELIDAPIQLNIRTFQRDVVEIRSIFGIDIRCDRSSTQYYISDDFQEGFIVRILEAIDIFTTLTQLNNISSQVLFEKRCSIGSQYIYDLLQAIKKKRIVTLSHQKYYEVTSTVRDVEPYALKEFKNRWYLFAKDLDDSRLKTFGLDRVNGVFTTEKVFISNKLPDPTQYFQDCFGIIRPTDGEPKEVILSTDPEQAKYLKSFPLHESQRIIKDDDSECVIKLRIYITYDFVQELLSLGDTIKVIAPESLQKELLNYATNMVKMYQ